MHTTSVGCSDKLATTDVDEENVATEHDGLDWCCRQNNLVYSFVEK